MCMRLILVCSCILAAAARSAVGDGGLVRMDDVVGPYKVVALTSPTPVYEGDVDLTILVRDAVDSELIDDVVIHVAIVADGEDGPSQDAWMTLDQGRVLHPGGAGAVFQVWPGDFAVHIRISGDAGVEAVQFPLQVAQSKRFHDVWPWLIPLPIIIGLWMLREWSTMRDVRRT